MIHSRLRVGGIHIQTVAMDLPMKKGLSSSAAISVLTARAFNRQLRFDQLVAPACPDELAAPKFHALLSHRLVRELGWGGKGVGSQGDGCAQLVARDAEAQQDLVSRLPAAMDVTCLELTIGAGDLEVE